MGERDRNLSDGTEGILGTSQDEMNYASHLPYFSPTLTNADV
jgi:hypothetical protein